MRLLQRTRTSIVFGAAAFCLYGQAGAADDARWDVLTPDHALWSDGLEGAVLTLDDGSYAMLLLRPDSDEALVSLAYPGTPGQDEVLSIIDMPDGGVRRLVVTGDSLIALPAPDEDFAAYGFVIAAEDFSILQAGLRWRLTSDTEEMVFPLDGSRIAIEGALAMRAAAPQTDALIEASDP